MTAAAVRPVAIKIDPDTKARVKLQVTVDEADA
jgi:hypothetical protein